ncbi:bifunctional acetate--CoA ligase family protein/GNAT family N-acetyltransferase [Taklimakanibacter lacteus]|uniref:bifunctional acetate--CoA ligase family protein/GNAT family N-acetyltransferase n=1 Tax=Taklimakanibacter lacteus TaxID=2268456 RepID=UPI000E671FFC
MSTYRLDKLFRPRSVAVVGASPKPRSLGRAVLANLKSAGFRGRIHVINPNYPVIEGMATASSLTSLGELPDLIVVTAPAAAVPQIIGKAGEAGVPAAIVISAGLGHGEGSFAGEALKAARRHGLRILGPNGLGLLVPPIGLNASFAARPARSGNLALVSQSGAIAAALVEWSARRSIGFSAVASIGDALDIDFADLLDHFALDPQTRAILLYVEAITNSSKFLSAARAAARVKPVIVMKAGRHRQASIAAATHTGALAGSDAVYDAAFRRAGLLRVADLDEFFVAAEGLGRLRPFPGRRLAILTNGGGLGVLATDRLIDLGGTLADISPTAAESLGRILPEGWSHSNPVDIVGDADAHRYAGALQALLDDDGNDAVLVLNVETALASSEASAAQVAQVIDAHRTRKSAGKPVFTSWIADDPASAGTFEAGNIPHFASEAKAVQGFMHFVRYREAQEALMASPPQALEDFEPDRKSAHEIIKTALSEGRSWLAPLEVTSLLTSYGIPMVEAVFAANPDEAARGASPLLERHPAVVAKILSRDIIHKSDIGGVRLNLKTPREVREATAEIMAAAKAAMPDANIDGVTLHPMITRLQARELIAGIADDQTFGPIIMFGAGGISVEVTNDKALALPPLDLAMARELMSRTRVFRLLGPYRNVGAAKVDAVAGILTRLSQLSADFPEIREVDLNPLLADADGAVVLDARIAIARFRPEEFRAAPNTRFAIRPYPWQWEQQETLRGGEKLLMRPIRPEDEPALLSFLERIDQEDIRLRFFSPMRHFSHQFIARLTQPDYGRTIAFLALDHDSGEVLGVVRLHADPDHKAAEFAILVRSDFKGRGLGTRLMNLAIRYGRTEGYGAITGQVLPENQAMLRLCRELGFVIAGPGQERACDVSLILAADPAARAAIDPGHGREPAMP